VKNQLDNLCEMHDMTITTEWLLLNGVCSYSSVGDADADDGHSDNDSAWL
jgi:hypothetical protein